MYCSLFCIVRKLSCTCRNKYLLIHIRWWMIHLDLRLSLFLCMISRLLAYKMTKCRQSIWHYIVYFTFYCNPTLERFLLIAWKVITWTSYLYYSFGKTDFFHYSFDVNFLNKSVSIRCLLRSLPFHESNQHMLSVQIQTWVVYSHSIIFNQYPNIAGNICVSGTYLMPQQYRIFL